MPFCRQLKALIVKNFIIKRRQLGRTIWEFIFPLIICGIIGYAGQNARNEGKSILMIVPTLIAFLGVCRFVLMQMVIDKEIKMRETLKILSMQTSAYGLSYFTSQLIFTVVISFLLTVTFLILQFVTPLEGL